MLIQSNDPKDYSEMRKPWATRRYKDPTEGIMRVTEPIARQMPDLDLPRMPKKARSAFQDILSYEGPLGNGSMEGILTLAQARGYCTHPCDWVPSSEGDYQFPKLYEPWAVWLATNGYTPYYSGVPLTAENWDAWKPRSRIEAFNCLRRRDRAAADNLLITVGAKKPLAVRLELVRAVGRNAMFGKLYPDDVPTMRHFLNDPSEKIRAEAAKQLAEIKGLETKEDHARALAKFFKVTGKGLFSKLRRDTGGPKVKISPKFDKDAKMQNYLSTDLDALVDVLGITAKDFVSTFDIERFKDPLHYLVMKTKNIEARRILAQRAVKAGAFWPADLFNYVEPELWQKTLDLMLVSQPTVYTLSFLGTKLGGLDMSLVQKATAYQHMVPSIVQEIETSELPVNKSHDPLRGLGLMASKEAAAELLQEALEAGIAESNPRLTMLKFNMAL